MTDQLMEELKRIDPLGGDQAADPPPPTPTVLQNAEARTDAALDRVVPRRRSGMRVVAFGLALVAVLTAAPRMAACRVRRPSR